MVGSQQHTGMKKFEDHETKASPRKREVSGISLRQLCPGPAWVLSNCAKIVSICAMIHGKFLCALLRIFGCREQCWKGLTDAGSG